MWTPVGVRRDTHPRRGGAQIERTCESCGRSGRFEEREVSPELRRQLGPLAGRTSARLFACAACALHLVTDEGAEGAGERRGLFGAMREAVQKVADRGRRSEPVKVAAPAPEVEADPLAEVEQELADRFAALEARAAANRSRQKPLM